MSDNSTVTIFRQMLDSGVLREHVVVEAERHLRNLYDLRTRRAKSHQPVDDVTDAIVATEAFIIETLRVKE